MENTKEQVYYVSGMHCASCELIIEKRLLEISGVKAVEASTSKGSVLIKYENQLPPIGKLNSLFKAQGYTFSQEPIKNEEGKKEGNFLFAGVIAAILIAIFLLLNKLGIGGLLNISSKSSLITLFVFGLLAGVSSCAALVGGMVLSMSKQWSKYKAAPHFLFNSGRLAAYGLMGAILGLVGSKISFSPSLTSALILVIAVLMIFLALQMLGVKALRKFQITLPKFITKRIANQSRLESGYLPFILGALTFFLPCGFTITAQGLALMSGSAIQGGLIMLAFALGTLPSLAIIGFSSTKLMKKPHIASTFLKVAGILVLFFALFNINAQMNVLGFVGFNLTPNQKQTTTINQNDLPPIVSGKQIIKMTAYASKDEPDYFKVRVGVPVRWEITADNARGCNSAIISTGLFNGSIPLTAGQISVKEFTPTKTGKFRFSCTMGMITGTIEVVNPQSSSSTNNSINTANAAEVMATIPSSVQGCGYDSAANACTTLK